MVTESLNRFAVEPPRYRFNKSTAHARTQQQVHNTHTQRTLITIEGNFGRNMRRPTSALLRPPPQRLPLLMLLLLIAGRASASVRSIGSSSNIDYEAAAAAAADDWLIGESRSRRQPVAENPLDAMSWLNLRRFVCGGDANTRCLTDERWVCARATR